MERETVTKLPAEAVEIIEGRNFGNLATLMPDGSPQVTPMWVETDGQNVLINTTTDRQIFFNIGRNTKVAIDVVDHADPYRYIMVRGHVGEVTTQGAEDQIHRLHRKYHGGGRYPLRPEEQRVSVSIVPERVHLKD